MYGTIIQQLLSSVKRMVLMFIIENIDGDQTNDFTENLSGVVLFVQSENFENYSLALHISSISRIR